MAQRVSGHSCHRPWGSMVAARRWRPRSLYGPRWTPPRRHADVGTRKKSAEKVSYSLIVDYSVSPVRLMHYDALPTIPLLIGQGRQRRA